MTRNTLNSALTLTGFAALASCAPVGEPQEFVSEAPAARVVGEAERCINVSQLRNTKVHDDRTIDFKVGRRTYRNTLDRSCPRLGFEESITYDVHGGQLCRPEIIYVLESFGSGLQRGVGCSLGDFVPIELIKDDEKES